MRALKISSIIALFFCVILQAVPYGIVVSAANIAVYYSYFSINAWGNGIIGPFFCGALSISLIGLFIGSFFFNHPHKVYLMTTEIVAWLVFFLSLTPIIFDSYTFIGGIISALLLFCAEVCRLTYSQKFKK